MADGNVGSLYMTLGLKDEVSAGLGKVAKSLTKSKSYTDELKREVEGLRKELKGVNGTDMSEPIKKALSFIKQYDKNVWASIETTNRLAYTLRGVFSNNNGEINIKLGSIPNAIREVSKLSKQLDGISDKNEKTAFKSQVSNALDYLRILQDISRKQAELNTLSKSSRNIDKAEIASAKNALNDMQMALVKQIFNRATNSSSLTDNNFVSEIKKLLSMSLREIGDYMRNLKKDNPLSVFVNSADMLTSKIAAANSKILEMQSLMRGSKIPNLMDTRSLDEMRGLVGAMSKLTNEKGIGQKTEKAKIDKLVSDYARLSSEMNLAMGTFRRMSREYDNANARLVSWYSKYRELQSIRDKRVSLYLDTKEVDAELNRIRALFGELNTIRNGLKAGNEGFIGMLGSRGTGVDTKIYNSVVKTAKDGIAEQEKLDKATDRLIAKREKADAEEYNRKKRQVEQRLSDIDREGKALQKNAEIQQRYSDAIDKVIAKKQKEHEAYQNNRDREQLQFELALEVAIQKRIALRQEEAQLEAKKLSSMSSQEEIQRRLVAYMEQINATHPKQPLFNQNGMNDLQRVYGKAFDELAVQYDKLKAKIDSYNGPTDNAGFVAWKNELAAIETKMQSLITLSEQAARANNAGTYKPYTTSIKEESQRRMQETNALKNAILERMATEEAADKKRKKAEKDAADAEKQRQRELDISLRRVQSLDGAYTRLKEATLAAKSYGFNTHDAETQLRTLNAEMTALITKIETLQTANFKNVLGTLKYTGTGTSVTEANRISAQYERANREAEKNAAIEEKRKQKIAEAGRQIQSSLVKGFKDANNAAGRLNSTVQDLKSLFMQGGLVFGAQQFAMSIIRTGGEMEKQHIAMQSILGDMQNANTMFNQTKELALQSPFTFSELNRDVKQLAAYGVEYENLYDTTKRLADMASGLGVSFERIALAFGQVQARGWLDGKELRQIAYAGIPLLDRLSKYYSMREGKKVSTSDVKGRITNREVSFQDVKNIFWEMTDAGGQFYNMQLTLSETLLGRYNKLKDAWEIMLADFARGDSMIGGTFKFVLDTVTSIVQQMHTLGPVMAAAFTGFAIKRGITAMGGTKGAAFLNTKANIASDLQAKVMQGQQLSAIEQRILVTKSRITNEDLKALSASKALTLQDLNRLRIAGQITAEQYKQYRNVVRQQIGHKTLNMQMMRLMVTMRGLSLRNGWSSFSTSALAAFRIVGIGAKALGATLWSAIGGLPGLIITGVTMGVSYLINKNAELKQSMTQTADELKDRYKQIGEFIRDNDVNKAIGSGDTKQIDNLIESYKEKLKELAPYDFDNFVMTAEEKKSHEERLKYLEEELEILQSANEIAQEKAGDSDTFSIMKNNMENAKNAAEAMLKARDKMLSFGATETDKTVYQDTEAVFNNTIETLKQFVASKFKGINNSTEIQAAYKQFRESMIAQIAPTEEAGNVIRAALDDSLGLSNGWLERRFLTEGYNLIEKVAGELALKIRSGKELNEAEKQKVKNLMESAANQLSLEYPMFANTLQDLLNQSDFIARIRLVYTPMGDIEKQVYNNMVPGNLSGDALKKAVGDYNILKPYLAGQTGFYEATNKVQQKLTSLWNEKKNRQRAYNQGKMSKELLDAATKEYEDLWNAAYNGLGYRYIPEDKKSNKTPKGSQEDEELKALRERIDAFKAFRQMYQKAKEVMPKSEAKNWAYGLFPEMKDLNPEDYIGSIEKLKRGFNFELTPERKKTLTSLNREIGDWKISEILKPEFEKAAANFKEALDRQMKQWDLYRTLLDKTGSESFANLAFTNGGIFDEQANNLIRQFETDYNIKFPGIYADEGDAKKSFEGIAGAYERWKAIADLVKNNYVKYLQEAADIIEKTATTEERILAINEKYDRLAKTAVSQGNIEVATSYRIQQKKEVASARLEGFEKSSEYTNFFGAILSQTVEQAKTAAEKIRDITNEAFQKGAIDAREYAKRIKQINEQMQKLQQPRKSFFNGGIQGIAQQKFEVGESTYNKASNEYEEWSNKFNEALKQNDITAMEAADQQMAAAKVNEAAGSEMMAGANNMMLTISIIDTIVHNIDGIIQGLNEAFGYVKEAASYMGADTESDGWQNASAWFSAASSGSEGAAKAWDGLKNGNVGGIISGVAQSITGPFTAFAKAHDAKMDRRIQQAERNIRAIDNMSNNISAILEKTLGGLYSYTNNADTVKMLKDMMKNNEKGSEAYNAAQKALNSGNYFDTQYAALLAQKSEIQKQRDAEDRKKKTDQDAIAQYDQQIKELDLQIKTYAQDFLKEMYSIDFKSWASQLTNSIVEAWSKGEDAATAYHDKVQELIKDLTKNILSQRIMEMALQPTLDTLQEILKQKGKLDETDIPKIADQLIEAGNNTVENITNILDALKEQGWDLSENGTLSVSNSIKGITEDTADLLASYINQCRADLSVVRNMHEHYYPQFSEIGNAQIIQMKAIAQNTLRNAEAAERIEMAVNSLDGNMKAVINGTKKFNVK